MDQIEMTPDEFAECAFIAIRVVSVE